MDYLDFELEIASVEGRDYRVAVLRSPAGEASTHARLPFGDQDLEILLLKLQNALLQPGERRRRIASPEQQVAQGLGGALFDFAMGGEVRTTYEISRREAAQHGKGLRLRLHIKAPELAALPWEFLYDPGRGDYLALSRYTPIIRYVDLAQSIGPLAVDPPLRILAMVVTPEDLPKLNEEKERRRVERALERLVSQGLVELTWLPEGSWRTLQRSMRSGPWHIFHLISHGQFDPDIDEGRVAFTGDYGRTVNLTATKLGTLLGDHPALRLVVLNTCEGAVGSSRDLFSGTAAILVRKGIPAVVAMQYEVSDRAAIEFAQTFYESVAEALPVDEAVAEARRAIMVSTETTLEWGTPVLYMRSPSGVLFDLGRPSGLKPPDHVPLPDERVAEAPAPEMDEATTRDSQPVATVESEPTAEPTEPPKAPPKRARDRQQTVRKPDLSELWVRYRAVALVGLVALTLVGAGVGLYLALATGGGPKAAHQTTPPPTNPSSGPTTTPSTAAPHLGSAVAAPPGPFGGPGEQRIDRLVTLGNRLVAVGIDDSDAGAWTSIDGNGWTRSNPTNLGGKGKLEMYGVAAFNNMFVAVGYETGNGLDAQVWLSRDGSSWERVPHTETFGGAGDQWMNRVATAGPGLVGVGVDGQNPGVWTSSDGIAWTQAPDAFPGGGSMRGVTKWGRLIVTVGFIRPEGAPLDPAAWYADTTGGALSWHQGTVPTAAGDQKMAAAVGFGDGLIAVGFSGSDAAVWQSNDGRTWRVVRQAAFRGSGNQEMFDVTNVAGIGLVAVGSDDDKGALWTSRDGKSWTRQLVGGKLIHSLVVQDGRLVLGGQTGGDAAVWTMEVVS